MKWSIGFSLHGTILRNNNFPQVSLRDLQLAVAVRNLISHWMRQRLFSDQFDVLFDGNRRLGCVIPFEFSINPVQSVRDRVFQTVIRYCRSVNLARKK